MELGPSIDTFDPLEQILFSTIDRGKRERIKACEECNKLHVSCQLARPCWRCSEKGIPCVEKKSRKRKKEQGTNEYPTTLPKENPIDLSYIPESSSSSNRLLAVTENQLPQIKSLTGVAVATIKNPVIQSHYQSDQHFRMYYDCIKAKQDPDNYAARISAVYIPLISDPTTLKSMISYLHAHWKITGSISDDQLLQRWSLISNHLKLFNQIYHLAAPTVFIECTGVIHYVNQSFRDITGFNTELPTNIGAFYLMLGASSYSRLVTMVISSIQDGVTKNITLPLDMQCHGYVVKVMAHYAIVTDDLGYIGGVMTLMPILDFPAIESQLPSTMKMQGTLLQK